MIAWQWLAALTLVAIPLSPLAADAPLAPARPTVCSLRGQACAMRDRAGRTATVWQVDRQGRRHSPWQAAIASSVLMVADDGRSLVELYDGRNLLDPAAGPTTTVLVFHRPGAKPVAVSLRSVVARPDRLPRTASHRLWARAYGFDGHGGFVLLTAENRSIVFDPATGQPRLPGRPVSKTRP